MNTHISAAISTDFFATSSAFLLLSSIIALAAARAMIDDKSKNAEEVAKKSVEIAADICVFTNNNITVEKL